MDSEEGKRNLSAGYDASMWTIHERGMGDNEFGTSAPLCQINDNVRNPVFLLALDRGKRPDICASADVDRADQSDFKRIAECVRNGICGTGVYPDFYPLHF